MIALTKATVVKLDIRAFSNPNGRFTPGGNHVTFLPNPLPPTLYYDSRLTGLIASSHAKLGELSGVGQRLPNPRTLITPYLRREAVLSSRIEGTQASLADLFMYEVSKDDTLDSPIKRLREVRNYVRSLEECLRQVEGGRRITLGLVKDGHRMLLRGVRGAERNPGQFRTVQNWIGSPDSPIEDAVYVPQAWSPAGSSLAMSCNASGHWHVQLVEYAGYAPTRIW
jgi:Fic family protein